jgi:hypothetical protein
MMIRQRRNRKFLGDDHGCLREQTVNNPAGVLALGFPIFRLFIAKQLAILKILNNLKHATYRLQMQSNPQVVK